MSESKGRYAAGTSVSTEKTIADIKAQLRRFGAQAIATLETGSRLALVFEVPDEAQGATYRFGVTMPLPPFDPKEFQPKANNAATKGRAGASLAAATEKRYQQEVARRYRSLLLIITGKLVAVEEGAESLQQAFWTYLMLPGHGAGQPGGTLYEATQEPVRRAYLTGQMPDLLPGLPGGETAIPLPAPRETGEG